MSPSPPPCAVHHDQFEMVFEAPGSLTEIGGHGLNISGTVRVIQGPRASSVPVMDNSTLVYAFVSAGEANLPLLPNQPARRVSKHSFEFEIPNRRFAVRLSSSTPSELIDEFENVLKWFCVYESMPPGKTSTDATAAPIHAPPQGMMGKAGDQGVAFVERYGDKINSAINNRLGASLENARGQETRNVNVGGKATSSVLGGARKVVGTGAGIAATVTDKASDVVGGILGNNPVMKGLRNAPEESKRFRFHDTLMSGMAAVGKVYVAVDEKGKTIISTTGDNASEIVREKYGPDAAAAASDSTRIAVDSYRIFRFPAKFGASALLKGAAKASVKRSAGKGQA